MKHLILGSSGQVGYHLVNFLKSINEEVIEFDIIIDKKFDLRLYINNELINSINNADFIYFLAFDIGGSIYLKKYQDTFEFIDNNIKIMDRVFHLLNSSKKPFIFASSQMSNMSYSTYGILKAVGERYTEALGGITVKFWNVYGYETDDEKAHVITDFIKMAQNDNKIIMKTDGSEQRQFLFGDDCAECLYILSQKFSEIDKNKPFHVTSFEWVNINNIANIVSTINNSEIISGESIDTVQLDKRNEPDDYILRFWKPKTKLEDGIKNIYDLMNSKRIKV